MKHYNNNVLSQILLEMPRDALSRYETDSISRCLNLLSRFIVSLIYWSPSQSLANLRDLYVHFFNIFISLDYRIIFSVSCP